MKRDIVDVLYMKSDKLMRLAENLASELWRVDDEDDSFHPEDVDWDDLYNWEYIENSNTCYCCNKNIVMGIRIWTCNRHTNFSGNPYFNKRIYFVCDSCLSEHKPRYGFEDV